MASLVTVIAASEAYVLAMADSRLKRVAPLVHQLADMVDEAARRLDLDVHIRQHELDALVIDDRLAELHALLGDT